MTEQRVGPEEISKGHHKLRSGDITLLGEKQGARNETQQLNKENEGIVLQTLSPAATEKDKAISRVRSGVERMERKDSSASDEDVPPWADNAFDSEITRMSLNADAILDSIRNETTFKSSNREEEYRDESSPYGSSSELDGDDEDDNLLDELQRLESVSAEIRQALDDKEDPSEDNDALAPESEEPLEDNDIIFGSDCGVPEKEHLSPDVASCPKHSCVAPKARALSSIPGPKTPRRREFDSRFVEVNSPNSGAVEKDGLNGSLVVAFLFIWSVILLLFGHALNHILDGEGYLRSPFRFD